MRRDGQMLPKGARMVLFRARLMRLLAALLSVCIAGVVPGQELTALDRYVAAPDPTYAYKLVNTIKAPGQTTYVLELTSQTWLTPKEVDRPVWKHWLTSVRLDDVDGCGGGQARHRRHPDRHRHAERRAGGQAPLGGIRLLGPGDQGLHRHPPVGLGRHAAEPRPDEDRGPLRISPAPDDAEV